MTMSLNKHGSRRTLQTIPGFAGLHVFADRPTGKTVGISLRETEAAVQAWEHMRGPIVTEQLRSTDRTEQRIGFYELVFSSTADTTFANPTS